MIQKILAVSILIFAPLFATTPSRASDSSTRLIQSIQRLNTWMGASESADQWRRTLKLNVLESQAAIGYRANPAVLQSIADRFAASSKVHPAFADVHRALQEHIQVCRAMPTGDVNTAIEEAKQGFRQTSVAELSQVRDQAVHLAAILKQYYQKQLTDFDRNEVFETIKIDEMIDYLKGLQFELPPERSAGILSNQIAELRRQQNEVIAKRDALPVDQTEKRAEFQKTIDEMEKQIKVVEDEARTILQADRPRQQRRVAIVRQLRTYDAGFETVAVDFHDAFLSSARASLDRFTRLFFAATNDNLEFQYINQLDALNGELTKLGGADHRLAAARAGVYVGWLENAGQAAPLVGLIRSRYSMPNAKLAVSSDFINEITARPVTDTLPVGEYLLGRFIEGQAYSSGNVDIDLIDNPDEAQLSIHLRGNINSDTYTRTGPITAFAGSQAEFEARRSIYAGLGGLVINAPYAAANLQSQFRGVDCQLRLIQRAAQRQYSKDKYLSEGISAGRVENRVLRQFREQTDEQLQSGREELNELKQKALDEIALLPDIHLRTTTQHVLAQATRATTTTLAAPTSPAEQAINPEIGIQIHETLASNYLDPIFAGKTFTNRELGEKATELLGASPKAFEGEDWQITFATARPIQFEFEDNRFRVVVNGRRFRQEGSEIRTALEIRLRFKIERINDKLRLVRDGDATIDFVGPRDAKAVAFAAFLEKKLNEVPEEGSALAQATELPANLIPLEEVPELGESPIAQNLRLVQCRAERGWFYLGWNHNSNGEPVDEVDLPAIVNHTPLKTPSNTAITKVPTASEAKAVYTSR